MNQAAFASWPWQAYILTPSAILACALRLLLCTEIYPRQLAITGELLTQLHDRERREHDAP